MTSTTTLEQEAFEQIRDGMHIALLDNPTAQGKYYYFTHEPDVELPWVAIDKSGPNLRSGNFGTKEATFRFLAEKDKVDDAGEAAYRISHPEDAGAEFDRAIGLTPGANLANGTNAEPTVAPSEPLEAAGDVLDTVEDVAPAPAEIEAAEGQESPYLALSDQELSEQIKAAEAAYYKEFLDFAAAEARTIELLAQLERENATLFARKKAAKEAKIVKAEELKTIAGEYFRRNPEEKKFDVYVTAKEFIDWDVDEAEAWPWVRENYPIAIIPPVKERLDYAQIIDYGKSCVKRKADYPPCLKRTTRTEVQLSTKVALPDSPLSGADPSVAA